MNNGIGIWLAVRAAEAERARDVAFRELHRRPDVEPLPDPPAADEAAGPGSLVAIWRRILLLASLAIARTHR